MTRIAKIGATLVLLATGAMASAQVQLHGGGATFPEPVYEAWITQYQKAHPDVKIDYQASGSGAGIKAITDKTSDFAGSDAPMNKAEVEKAGGADNIVEVPTVAGAVVLAYNIPGFTGDIKLDGETVGAIYLGEIKTWNDPKLAALNPGVNLPALPITPMHRSDGSGTTYVFSNYVCTQSPSFQAKIGAGKNLNWPVGSGGPQNNGVAQLIKGTNGGIGYIELQYALKNNIPYALMKNKDGKFVKASTESVALAGEAAAEKLHGHMLVANIWNQPGEKVYPIASFTYMICYKDMDYLKDAAKAKALADFLRWSTSDGEALAPELNYAPLAPAIQKKVAEALGELTFEKQPVK